MSNFINTIDELGDDGLASAYLSDTITEFKDDILTELKGNAFYSSANLTKLVCPNVRTVGPNCFWRARALRIVDFAKLERFTGTYNFNICESMKALILRSETMCTAEASTVYNATGGNIYVPAALVETYKTATNWSTQAARFRALEDYTVDGTIYGELDESKI